MMLEFATEAHKFQFRKDGVTPYINHPIKVCSLVSLVGGITNETILCAALGHDLIEDTSTTYEEIVVLFGKQVADNIMECSDDKNLPKAVRKRLQVEKVRYKSYNAKIVKLADKIANLNDIIVNPPGDWSVERKKAYFDWAKEVVDAGLRGVNPGLEEMFDDLYQKGQYL